jgi:glucan phosphoethanolaminetransferase (alkaline phosphatase superfamily)
MIQKPEARTAWMIEGVWILSSALIALLFLIPIWAYRVDYPFTWSNLLFIAGFVTFSRWLFLWKFTPYAWWKWFKAGLIFAMIPAVLIGIRLFYGFRTYLDEVGLQEFMGHLNPNEQHSLSLFIRSEMIFFGTAFILTAACVPFKMVRSLWNQYNRNQV